MNISSKKEYLTYFVGDIFFFVVSLWLALSLRHFSFPTKEFFMEHIVPFSFLFAIWIIIFFIAGLYDKQTAILRKKIPARVINAQIINGAIGVLFFYLSPYSDIAPKTNLFLYILVSSILIISWRLTLVRFFKFGRKQSVTVLGESKEIDEIIQELKENKKYNVDSIEQLRVDDIKKIDTSKPLFIIADFQSKKIKPLLSDFYKIFFSEIVFLDVQEVYENLFEKISLSMADEQWLLRNIYSRRNLYSLVKRMVDVFIALPIGLISLILYPGISLAIKLDDGGPVFIVQDRIGQKGKRIKIVKFRSMKVNDKGAWVKEKDERITRVGSFLRKSRLDELPQLFAVIKGEISLIGPRPDIIGLGEKLEKEIRYYKARNIAKPGLSGWAQIKQDLPPQSIEETKERLMHDLYYIKNRSLLLDLKIILRTLQILLSRSGV